MNTAAAAATTAIAAATGITVPALTTEDFLTVFLLTEDFVTPPLTIFSFSAS